MAGPVPSANMDPVTPMGGVKAFDCRNCGGQIELRAPGQSLTAACSHCGSVTDLMDENLRIIQKAKKKITHDPVIPLGTRGKLRGHTWEVIGMMVRQARGYQYFWEEYLLYNPWQGFRWLSNNYGHWSWITPVTDLPDWKQNDRYARLDGTSYQKFTHGYADVHFVLGEFYWQVRRGDAAGTVDFIKPPYMLSYEAEDGSVNWSLCEYIEPEAVKEAFGLDRQMPPKLRVAANQPNRARNSFRALLPVAGMLLAALIALQLLFSSTAKNALVWDETFLVKSDTLLVSPPIALEGSTGNVEVQLKTGLSNNWMEMSAYLHNPETGRDYAFKLNADYYHGVDGGESWSEGSSNDRVVLNGIPGGNYEMVMAIYSSVNYPSFSVEVRRDVPFYSNFLFVFVLLLLYPVYLFIQGLQFEKMRWQEAEE